MHARARLVRPPCQLLLEEVVRERGHETLLVVGGAAGRPRCSRSRWCRPTEVDQLAHHLAGVTGWTRSSRVDVVQEGGTWWRRQCCGRASSAARMPPVVRVWLPYSPIQEAPASRMWSASCRAAAPGRRSRRRGWRQRWAARACCCQESAVGAALAASFGESRGDGSDPGPASKSSYALSRLALKAACATLGRTRRHRGCWPARRRAPASRR